MAWSNSFVSRLTNASISPLYHLRFFSTGPNGFEGAGSIQFASWQGNVRIGADGVQVDGVRVIPGRWNVSFGGFSVPLVGDIRNILPYLQRGMLAELRVDIGTGFERIACGALRSITGEPPSFMLSFGDLLSALSNTQDLRADAGVGLIPRQVLYSVMFRNVGQFATMTAARSGVWNTLDVDETKIFQRQTGSWPSTYGLIKIVDDSSGDEFFMHFNTTTTSSGAGALTGLIPGTQHYPSLIPAPSNIAINSKVYSCAVLAEFPGLILGQLLLSTGFGTNGPLDVLPAEWSLGGEFDQTLFDFADAENQKEIIRSQSAAYTYKWEYPVVSSWTTGLRDLVNIASNAGQWPVWRQNALSWRGCMDPRGKPYMAYDVWPVYSISDADLIQVMSHEFFNPELSSVYSASETAYAKTSSTNIDSTGEDGRINGKITSLPAESRVYRDNSVLYNGDYLTPAGISRRESMALGDNDRMGVWDFYTHEKLVLKCHLKLAVLCPGDLVSFTSNYLYGIEEGPGEFYTEKKCMIVSISYNFSMRFCIVGLAIPRSKQKI